MESGNRKIITSLRVVLNSKEAGDSIMDIAALSMAMSQSSLMQDASLSVMKIAMDTAKVNAANMTELLSQTSAMQQSVQPHLGSGLDIKI
jgi:hypothetical protein